MRQTLEIKWTVSHGRDTDGYNICSLYVDGKKKASCNGGGYDMIGTCLGDYIEKYFPDRLKKLTTEFYGLSFRDPTYDATKVLIDGQTIEEREKEGKSLGLERYQAYTSATTKIPDEKHWIPRIDGGCGESCVEKIINAIGFKLTRIPIKSKNNRMYLLEGPDESDRN